MIANEETSFLHVRGYTRGASDNMQSVYTRPHPLCSASLWGFLPLHRYKLHYIRVRPFSKLVSDKPGKLVSHLVKDACIQF